MIVLVEEVNRIMLLNGLIWLTESETNELKAGKQGKKLIISKEEPRVKLSEIPR